MIQAEAQRYIIKRNMIIKESISQVSCNDLNIVMLNQSEHRRAKALYKNLITFKTWENTRMTIIRVDRVLGMVLRYC